MMIGQVYLLMRYPRESSHLGISYLFGFCVFGFSSTIRKFYSALIRNSIITSGYIWCFPFAEVDRFRNNIYAQVAMVMLIGLLGKMPF
jgi:hypothetical protein